MGSDRGRGNPFRATPKPKRKPILPKEKYSPDNSRLRGSLKGEDRKLALPNRPALDDVFRTPEPTTYLQQKTPRHLLQVDERNYRLPDKEQTLSAWSDQINSWSKELRFSLDGRAWDSLNIEQKTLALESVGARLSSIHSLKPISVRFETNHPDLRGEYLPSTIVLNDYYENDFETLFGENFLHEWRHHYQMGILHQWEVSNKPRPFHELDPTVIMDWSDAHRKYPVYSWHPRWYRNVLLEVDARGFAKEMANRNQKDIWLIGQK